MKISIVVSGYFAFSSVLAGPIHRGDGKSSTFQYSQEVSIPKSYDIATNHKSRSYTFSRKTFRLTTTKNVSTSHQKNRGGRGNGGNKNNGTTTSSGGTTVTKPKSSSTSGGSSLDTATPDTSPNDTTTDTTSEFTMPAGSSTGLARGASVRSVGADGTFMSESAIKPYLLAAHNIVRSLHEGTGSIAWDSSIAQLAQTNTPTCDFEHTSSAKRKGLGENISYNTNASPEDQALRQWYANEVVNYNFNDPTASSGVIGHMTAMVWKDVKIFGCAVRNCGDHGMGLFLKCNYSPTPNIIGQYDEKVGQVKGASTETQIRAVVKQATGFEPS
ncbi:Helothermine [Dactylellina cionopaga]|nr:Helothermine [Dactylellina cionopaga]